MTNRKNTTRARLIGSALAMLLCVAMLVGTTFAWFSDSASTGDTTITAGNLDVALYSVTEVGENGAATLDEEIGTEESIFDIREDFLWEPGAMWVSKPFVVKNNGSLALQYKLNIDVKQASEGTPNILDRIQWKLAVPQSATPNVPDTQTDRENFWNGLVESSAGASTGILPPELNSTALEVVLYWEPADSVLVDDPEANPDNAYNLPAEEYLDGEGAPKATFSLNVFATQVPYEEDSFGDGYDGGINLNPPTASDGPTKLEGGDLVYSGSVVDDGDQPIQVSGEGTVDLQKDARVENTNPENGCAFQFGDEADPSAKTDVTLTGEGTVAGPDDLQLGDVPFPSFAVRILPNTTVTVEGGNYEGGFDLTGPVPTLDGAENPKLIIKGGSINGFIAIHPRYLGTRENPNVIIEDPSAVSEAVFSKLNKDAIQIPETGYQWVDAAEGTDYPETWGGEFVKLVPAT